MKIVNKDLWLGISSASNGAKSFAHITLDFTILVKMCTRCFLRKFIGLWVFTPVNVSPLERITA